MSARTNSSGPLRAVRWSDFAGTKQVRLDGTNTENWRLKKWHKALGGAMAGSQNARLCIVGDSTCAGILTASGGKAAQSSAALMGKVLAGCGVRVNMNNCFGNAQRAGGATFTNYDPRWVTNGAWNTLGANSSLGGTLFYNASDAALLQFAPVDPVTGAAFTFDTIDVWYLQNTGYGTFTISIDGGATPLTTVNAAGARAMIKATVSCTSGTNTVSIKRTSGGAEVVQIMGVATSLAAHKYMEIFNVAAGGFASADIYGSAGTNGDFVFSPAFRALTPDLTIIDIGINDWRTLAYTSAYDANLQGAVTNALTTGDCILCKPVPSQIGYSANTTQANMDLYREAIDRVAAANGLMVFDKVDKFASYTAGNALGMYSDGLHPSAAGYGSVAFDLADCVMR